MSKLSAMRSLLGQGDSTLAKRKVMTAAEGRLADLEAMSGKRKALTKEQIDSAAGKGDRKVWTETVKSVGYIPLKGNK